MFWRCSCLPADVKLQNRFVLYGEQEIVVFGCRIMVMGIAGAGE